MDPEHDLRAVPTRRPAGEMVDVPDPILDFETLVVPHTNHVEAKAAIRRLHARYKPPGGKQFKARALLIVGAPGSGKTTALEDYMRDYPDLTLENVSATLGDAPESAVAAKIEVLRDGDIRRIVYVEAPKRTTQRALVAALLGAFGYKAYDHWNTSDIIGRIEFYAQELGTEMIFIDEGHHMVSETDPWATEDVSEFIKSLLNRVKTQIVIAGLPRLLEVTRYQQLRRRLQPSMILTPYNWASRRGRIAFSGVLGAFERMLRLPEPSGLAKHDFARRIYVATGGEVGIVSKYLSEALSLAKARNLPSVTKELMAEVHASWHRVYEPDDILDFDAILDEEEEAKRSVERGRDSNPFLCDDNRLKTLWADLKAVDRPLVQPQKAGSDGSRKTKLKAKGRPAYTPFTRT